MKTIDIRRSVRSFKDLKVEADKVDKLLRAAMQAPSAGNQQPWEFVTVEASVTKEALSEMSPYAKTAKNAPLIIAILANERLMRFPETMQQDLGACTENLLLEAVDQGLGTTWMSVYPDEERISCLRSTLNLPDYVIPYSIVVIGYPAEEGANKFVDRYDGTRIHRETYTSN